MKHEKVSMWMFRAYILCHDLKRWRNVTKGRVDVTDDAIDAVMNNIMTLDGFDKDGTAGYEVKAKDGRTFILSLYDKDKYKLVSKDKR